MFGSGRSVLGYLIDDGAKLNVASGGREDSEMLNFPAR